VSDDLAARAIQSAETTIALRNDQLYAMEQEAERLRVEVFRLRQAAQAAVNAWDNGHNSATLEQRVEVLRAALSRNEGSE
jgi:hypothetical protein